jgi:lysophospholipase L1-like esterase
MNNMRYSRFVLLILIVLSQKIYAQQIAPFHKGDRVAFVGNSITDGGHYHSYIWLYYMTHFPGQRIDIFNAGIGGDIAQQINDRFDTDVSARKPTVIALTFGMNDTGYQNFLRPDADQVADEKVKEAYLSFQKIEKHLQGYSSARKIMIATSPYDETSKIKAVPYLKKNAAIMRIASYQQEAAKANNWEYVDFNTPLLAINLREEQRDPMFTLCGQDRIHPTNDGHFVMAYTFLKDQGFTGKPVADFSIDAAKQKVKKAENCKITDLTTSANTVSFIYDAASLPYPIDTISRGGSGLPSTRRQSDALSFIPFTEEFNRELLTVSGLKSTVNYRLTIDGIEIGDWTGKAYEEGINLALLDKTPQYQQALSIMALNEERWSIERRLREYYWLHYSILTKKGLLFNDAPSTMDSVMRYARRDIFVRGVVNTYKVARLPEVREAWQKEMAVLIDHIYTINKPKKHHIEIEALNR